MVPLVIVGLLVKFDVSVVFLSGFVQEREIGSRYCSFVFGVSEVLFWVLMSCCCDASLLRLGGSSTSFWVEFCFGVLFCSVLLSLSYSAQVCGSVSVLEKFDNFFKVCSVYHASDWLAVSLLRSGSVQF